MHALDKQALYQRLREQPSTANNSRIRATNDIEALERWLDEYFEQPRTFRTYRKEGERFLVWCAVVRSQSLRTLMREDVEAYIEFLKNPQPRDVWCGPRRKKDDPSGEKRWYPFAGPLSGSAIKTALASLTSFLSFLVDANYINYNPFTLIRRKTRFRQKFDEAALSVQERILDEQEWRAFTEALTACTDPRVTFLVHALYFLGLRIEEFAGARWSNCKNIAGKWWFFVRGKGDRLGKVPINSELLHAIMIFRHGQGLSPLPQENDTAPLIPSTRNAQIGLCSRQMSNLIKAVAKDAASQFPEQSLSHKKLMKLSPHWLRHLSASRQDLAGISITNIKSNLRHQNEQTTRIYVHSFDDERHREMEKLRLI